MSMLYLYSVLDDETALLTFCITDKGSIGFVVSKSHGVQSLDINGFKKKDLDHLLFKPDEKGYITGGWVGDYQSYIDAFRTYNHYKNEHKEKGTFETERQLLMSSEQCNVAFQAWRIDFENVLFEIGVYLFDPLLAQLPPQIERLILLPSDGLFLLPLHAIPLSDGNLLCERYCVSYTPSISLLREMQSKARTVEGKDLYALINPQEDNSLVFSEFEGRVITELFQSPQVDVGKNGTKHAVLGKVSERAYLHFSCHGNYNWNDPPQSGLYLAGERLCLADLLSDEVDMSSARLVTLSACETGITDILKGSADEFVGLPAGFMVAGVPCVVSSLWSVPDIFTSLLMEMFYSNHVGGMDIPLALQQAQHILRGLSSTDLKNYMERCFLSGKWEGKRRENIEQFMEYCLKMTQESLDKPFQDPYYWAAFTVTGA